MSSRTQLLYRGTDLLTALDSRIEASQIKAVQKYFIWQKSMGTTVQMTPVSRCPNRVQHMVALFLIRYVVELGKCYATAATLTEMFPEEIKYCQGYYGNTEVIKGHAFQSYKDPENQKEYYFDLTLELCWLPLYKQSGIEASAHNFEFLKLVELNHQEVISLDRYKDRFGDQQLLLDYYLSIPQQNNK